MGFVGGGWHLDTRGMTLGPDCVTHDRNQQITFTCSTTSPLKKIMIHIIAIDLDYLRSDRCGPVDRVN